uniref:putative L-aspartate dehydrogenase n=1 Tax=Ciona intestinalis TaxID=7719 RepID=UPI000180C0FE|nr:putative L-aspartate dehydrogenase [Ciona intestinalis]|eukprot:XP_026694205.1 putative L-aspartate dehydrogenase [Ciona intestinalis]
MKVGIIGFGNLGRFLADFIQNSKDMELEFVWNRSKVEMEGIPEKLILDKLEDLLKRSADLIVEVAHPSIAKDYGKMILSVSDFFIGSPTALADQTTEDSLRSTALQNGRALYVPSGAFWGAQDIQKMAQSGSLSSLKVTMKKHPSCFKLSSKKMELLNKQSIHEDRIVVLFEGSVRELCPLAPNNVNTMAAAAIAASNLGFDNVVGCLVADPKMGDWHIVEIEVGGATSANGDKFTVKTTRSNPANPGAVTGSATFASFRQSLLQAKNRGPGVHLC